MSEESWWTTPLEDDHGNMIMVTGRDDVDKFRKNPRNSIRITITQPYDAQPDGMPTRGAQKQLEEVLSALESTFEKDPVAMITGIYTGGGERTMVLYTASTNIFNKKLNEALAALPLLPLTISAENDPEWAEYDEMRELSKLE